MKNWINDRKREVTTWSVGIPSLVLGIMTLLKANGAQEVAGAIAGQAEQFASGNWTQGLMMIGLGVVGLFATEK
jgi:ABC-type uncharacterized transport system permease subunit